MTWRERPGDPREEGPTVRLWSGEVVLRTGQGLAGPFFIHRMAATAWAFSNALGQAEEDIFECQAVPYVCVRRFAAGLLLGGEKEARRLNRFDVSPLRPWGSPIPVGLPDP